MRARSRLRASPWWVALLLAIVFVDRAQRTGPADTFEALGEGLGVAVVVVLLSLPMLILVTPRGSLRQRDQLWIVGGLLAWYAAARVAGWLPALSFNWDGMITATVVVAILVLARSDLSSTDFGICFPTERGWLWPSAVAAAAAATLVLVLEPGGSSLSGEELAVNLTMPGISEELLFRGFLLGILDHRWGKPWRLWGAAAGWGLIVTTVLFGLVHVVQPIEGITLAWRRLATLPLGFALGWIRERSGSVLPAIVAHNLVNTAGLAL